jgi:hypothetical protein
MLESNIPTPLSLDPLDMSMPQRSFVSHYYSVGGGSGVVGGSSRHTRGKGKVREEEVEEDNEGFLSSGSGKIYGKDNKNEFEEDNNNNANRNWTVLGLS